MFLSRHKYSLIVSLVVFVLVAAVATASATGARRVTVAQAKQSIRANGPQFGDSLTVSSCYRSGRFIVCAVREMNVEYGGEVWDFDYSACVDRRRNVSNTVESDACGWAAAN